jgi:hypothetical protein
MESAGWIKSEHTVKRLEELPERPKMGVQRNGHLKSPGISKLERPQSSSELP